MGKKLDIAVALKIGADVSASVAKSFGETKSHLDKLTRAAALAAKEQAAAEAKYDKARQQKRQRAALIGERKRLVAERGAAINEAESIHSQWKASKAKADKFGGKEEIKRARDLERAFEQAGKKVDNTTRALDKHKQKLAEAGKESFALAGKTKELEKEVDKLGDAAAKADKKLSKAEGWNKLKSGALAFTSIAVGAVAAVGSVAAATVTALWKIDKSVSDRVESINNTSKGAGVSADTLQTFRLMAFKKGNLDDKASDRMLQNFLDNSQKAMVDPTGGKKFADAMRQLGVNPTSLRGKTRNEGVLAFLDMLERNKDNANASVPLRTLLGARFGHKAKTITGGRGEFDKTYKEGIASGEIINGEGRSKAEEFDDALDKIGLKLKGIENIIAGETFKPFADALNTAADTIAKHAPEIKKFAKTFGKTIEDFVNSGALTRAIEKMGKVFGVGLKLTENLLNAGSAHDINSKTIKDAEWMAQKAKSRSDEASSKVESFADVPEEKLTPQQKLDRLTAKQLAAIAERARLNSDKATLNAAWWSIAMQKIPIVGQKGREQDQRLADAMSKASQEIASYAAQRKDLEQLIAKGGNTTNNITNNNYISTTADPNATAQAVADASRKTLNDLHYDSKP